MLLLPLLNTRLQACSEDWAQIMPIAQGHHCARCNRTVLDFTQSPANDLESAFRAAPDGRVCGQFYPDQLAPDQPAPLPARPALRPRLRRFLVVLLLVCGLGLGAQQAVAQVLQELPPLEHQTAPTAENLCGKVEEEMPFYKNGGIEKMLQFIERNLRYPKHLTESGRVFVNFTVDSMGTLHGIKIQKGFRPAADSAALQVVRRLGPWIRANHNGLLENAKYTIPVTFTIK